MARYCGVIGFIDSTDEVNPGIYEERYVERKVKGDLLNNYRRLISGEGINDDVTMSNKISIVMDPFIKKSFHSIRYATYMGSKWKVDSVEVVDRRLILTLGGVYNG